MAPKIARNSATVAGRKIKKVRRRKEKPSPSPPWTDLPIEITANILHRLRVDGIVDTAQKVCKTWRSVCKDPILWRVIDMWYFTYGCMLSVPSRLDEMCRRAVDRSQGLLVDISLGLFVTNDLLDYIAERSKKLRSLRLVSHIYVDGDGVIKAIKSFPLLEVLEVNMIVAQDFNEIVETVARSCPLLRSFAFNNDDPRDDCRCNKSNTQAFAIPRCMPKLRHLKLRGNGLTNEGLEAILDGCPHLESLDLRWSNYVKLEGDLGKRLSKQIKYITYPTTPDHEWQEDDYRSFDIYPY